MTRRFSKELRALALAGVALAGATAVHAQEAVSPAAAAPEEAGEAGLVDIVVTAEKRETNLQKTPIAISVLGGEALADRHVQSLLDLQDGAVPSLRISPTFTRNSALSIGIRGITGGDSNQPSRDAGIGIYIDGIYLGRAQGLGMALLDVERIEVLKGPQGTLFGRNSVGGAVSIVTRKPSGELQLRQTVGVRNFGGYSAETHVDLPSFANISLKFDGIITKRDGTVKNTLQGADDFNLFNRRGAHVAALWEPSDSFTAQLDADYSHDQTTSYYVQLLNKNPAAPALAPLVQVQPDRAETVDIGVPEQPSVGETYGYGLHLNWRPADGLEVRSITSWRHLKQNQYDNGIGAHAGVFRPNATFSRYSLASMRQHQFSQEFQLVGNGARIDYVAGLYYFHEKGDDDAWSPNTMQWNATGTVATPLPSFGAGAATPFPDRASTAKADSYAAFGQATWTPPVLADMLRLTAGGRFTHDKKSGLLYKVNGAAAPYSFTFSKDHFDPQVTITFDPSNDVEIYGKWGTAYRAGGANSRSLTYRSYGPEKVSTFEAGLKTSFWGKRGRFNVAAYTTRYTDIQIDFTAPNINNTNRTTTETMNAPGHGTIKGIEVDASLAPLPGLTLSAAYAYTEGNLPQAANPFLSGALQTVFITYTPKNAGSASVDYALPVGSGDAMLRAHLDANMAGGYRAMPGEATLTDKSFVVNGRLALGGIDLTRGAQLELSLWSRNLFNEQHVFVRSHSAWAAGGDFGVYNEPRTFGVDGTLRF